jgi:hypothetical protein
LDNAPAPGAPVIGSQALGLGLHHSSTAANASLSAHAIEPKDPSIPSPTVNNPLPTSTINDASANDALPSNTDEEDEGHTFKTGDEEYLSGFDSDGNFTGFGQTACE